MLGVEVLGLTILAVEPTPDMPERSRPTPGKRFQGRADEAIHARRNAAGGAGAPNQRERARNRDCGTAQATADPRSAGAADIAVEERRSALIERRSENERRDADARAYTLRATLEPVRDIDWRTLMAVSGGAADPKLMIALAFRELAENAGQIGTLNVTPDLLTSLRNRRAAEGRDHGLRTSSSS